MVATSMQILHEDQRCYFGKSEIFLDVRETKALVLILTVQFNIWTLAKF